MTQNTEYLNNDDFSILVFKIQDVDINCNTMKTTNKSERILIDVFGSDNWIGLYRVLVFGIPRFEPS